MFKVLIITDRKATKHRQLADVIELATRAVEPHSVAVQLREKDLSPNDLVWLASDLLSVCKRRGVELLLNHHWELARRVGADGVHLTTKSESAEVVREKWPEALIGVSTHYEQEIAAARDFADYATYGPVYMTPSKVSMGQPQGVRAFKKMVGKFGFPLVALGGINLHNAADCIANGAAAVAGIRMFMNADDPGKVVGDLLRLFPEKS